MLQPADGRGQRAQLSTLPDVHVVRDQPAVEALVTVTDAAGLVHRVDGQSPCDWMRIWMNDAPTVDLEDKLVTCLQCIALQLRPSKSTR